MATTKITSPDLFNLESLNTALKLPSGTTAERPTSPSTGEWRYNTTTNLVEFWDGGEWRDLQSEDIPPIPSENFNTVLYDGTSATHAITGVGFQPDLVWIKDRNNTESHIWNDSTRGAGNDLSSNSTNAQANRPTGFTSFDSDGFTLGTDSGGVVNDSSRGPYVAWCWKANGGTTSSNTEGSITSTVQANTKAGFSVVKFVGTGANATVGHGLGAAPEIIIFKSSTAISGWKMFTNQTSSPSTQVMELSDPSGVQTPTNPFNSTLPSSTVISLGSYSDVNNSGNDMMAYCFKSVAGYSKIGSYTGNGSINGPIVNTGFEPAFLMTKQTNTTSNWVIVDNKRSTTNPRNKGLRPNTNDSESTVGDNMVVDFLTNGFQLKQTSGANDNGGTFLYIAFASDPSAAPVLADSFANKLYTGTGSATSISGLGFSPSLAWIKGRTNTASHQLFDTLRGATYQISSDTTGAQTQNTQMLTSFDTDGFSLGNQSSVNGSGVNYVAWNWKANPVPTINTDGTIQSFVSANQASGFSVVKWTSTSDAADTIGHGLSSKPDVVLYKKYSATGSWFWYTDIIDGSWDEIILNSTAAKSDFAGTYATSTTFKSVTSSSGADWITYCFHSVTGYSKFGTYAGSGSNVDVVTGFQPDFVLVRNTGVEDWNIMDSARGGNERLFPNDSRVESTTTNACIFNSDGFTIGVTGNASLNNAGDNYIYMAYKANPGTPAAIPAGEVAYLVIAAGGGAGGVGGGGGAGGLRTSYGNYTGGGQSAESNITLSAQTYTITIGAGGTASATGGAFNNDGNTGSNGTSSVFGTITSFGGGGGTGGANTALSGGSGGGCRSGSPGNGTYGQGFDGATGDIGGGGGGAGGTGLSSTAGSCGANGGPGLNVPITGATTFYAGGGAGGVSFASGCSASSGGIGGGGDAGANAGTANTGGGGGGGSWTNNANYTTQGGGNGGSGVVILRMNTSDYSGTTTGSPTVTTDGSETILTYTGSGTYVHS